MFVVCCFLWGEFSGIHTLKYFEYFLNKGIAKNQTMCYYNVRSVLTERTNGPVVQLVRTLACHARGRRFEPVPGRHLLLWLRWQSTSLVRMRSPVRIWLAAPKWSQVLRLDFIFYKARSAIVAPVKSLWLFTSICDRIVVLILSDRWGSLFASV